MKQEKKLTKGMVVYFKTFEELTKIYELKRGIFGEDLLNFPCGYRSGMKKFFGNYGVIVEVDGNTECYVQLLDKASGFWFSSDVFSIVENVNTELMQLLTTLTYDQLSQITIGGAV